MLQNLGFSPCKEIENHKLEMMGFYVTAYDIATLHAFICIEGEIFVSQSQQHT